LSLSRKGLDEAPGLDSDRSKVPNAPEEFCEGSIQCVGDLLYRRQGRVPAASLHGADIVGGQFRALGQLLEREPESFSSAPNCVPEFHGLDACVYPQAPPSVVLQINTKVVFHCHDERARGWPIDPITTEMALMALTSNVTGRQIGLAAGALTLIVAGTLFAFEGSYPDFVCRGRLACTEDGACSGRGFTCVAASDTDCRTSVVCASHGSCSVDKGSSGCVAASDADCARSDDCKTAGDCVFLLAEDGPWRRCTTAVRRMEHDRSGATKSVNPWLALIESAAKGAETSAALAATIAAQQFRGFEIETPTPVLLAMEVGTAGWNGRRLSAAVVRVSLPLVNRSAGERRSLCLVQTAVHDDEFKMWREMQTGDEL
jgi:hypothetical protein